MTPTASTALEAVLKEMEAKSQEWLEASASEQLGEFAQRLRSLLSSRGEALIIDAVEVTWNEGGGVSHGATKLENFERAMSTRMGSIRIDCVCGKTYYDATAQGSWHEGEFEKLSQDPSSVALDYPPSWIGFEGQEFADACVCWHPRAEKLIRFIEGHARGIVEYLSLEKQRKMTEAEACPVMKESQP
jgi:hypothetical protein